MDKQTYLEKSIEYLEANHPELQVSVIDNFSIEINQSSNSHTLSLEHPYELSSNTNFTQWQQDLEEFLASVEKLTSSLLPKFEDVRSEILPQVKEPHQFEELPFDKSEVSDKLLTKVFIPERLTIGWVIDQTEGFIYVTESMINKWGVTQDKIEELAIQNLIELPNTKDGLETAEEDGKVVSAFWQTNDGYDAARILLPDFFDRFTKFYTNFEPKRGEVFVVAIPNRDFLITAPTNMTMRLYSLAHQKYKESAHPISFQVFTVTKEGVKF